MAKFLESQAKDLKRKANQRVADKADAQKKLTEATAAMNEFRATQEQMVSLAAQGKTGPELQNARDIVAIAAEKARAAKVASDQATAKASAVPHGSAPTGPWMGAAGLAIVIGAVADARPDHQMLTRHGAIVVKTCTAVMAQVDVLTEDELKKENQDVSIAKNAAPCAIMGVGRKGGVLGRVLEECADTSSTIQT